MDIRIEVKKGQTLPPLWQQKEDAETDLWGGGLRDCATGGCPAVFTLLTPRLKVPLTKDWQYYLIAINYNMTLENISLVLDKSLAFCNDSGFRSEPLRNYILGKDLTAVTNTGLPAYPKFDKDRTCSRSVLTGIEEGEYVRLTLFNGNLPPPMKPGKSLPQRIQDIRLDDYKYNPREHRWMFMVANTVTSVRGGSSVAAFPRGARYDWTGDTNIYTFLPHVSRHSILYPKKYLKKVEKVESPYRVVRLSLLDMMWNALG